MSVSPSISGIGSSGCSAASGLNNSKMSRAYSSASSGLIVCRFSVTLSPEEALEYARDILELLRSEEHTSELQSRLHLVCRLLLEKTNSHVVKRAASPRR